MSSHLEGDIIAPSEASTAGVIRVERVWQHRHGLELTVPRCRRNTARIVALGIGGLMLGAICVFAYSDLIPASGTDTKRAMASTSVGHEIAAPSTVLRDVVDIAPAISGINETQVASLPYVAIPTKRPLYEPVQSGKPDRSTSTTRSSDVVRFDKCKPSCETRDPLVVGTTSASVPDETAAVLTEPAKFESHNTAMDVGASALNGAGYVLTQTAALPLTTLRLGRDAVLKVSRLD
ncbi:hypothetical protein DXM27_24740 [Rhizobium rhizogenes]|uniref:Uncharacterized protein n=1 Tax=Rhizobium rhizogenes TaxID=359 RepID=A0AA88EW10_RHIRH|nr:hypothetical protein [Rhizobium rhizogenes]KAA3497950.1 hypothetical protein DXM27_24740 [Rhizobium rhizogenes]KAA3521761.1 hypothetical protein DXM29_23850 [Agrobacterium tumefaciens]